VVGGLEGLCTRVQAKVCVEDWGAEGSVVWGGGDGSRGAGSGWRTAERFCGGVRARIDRGVDLVGLVRVCG
jgi:hypothetical protein